jgi:hypothetical protein
MPWPFSKGYMSLVRIFKYCTNVTLLYIYALPFVTGKLDEDIVIKNKTQHDML